MLLYSRVCMIPLDVPVLVMTMPVPACSTYHPWDLGAMVTVVIACIFDALYGAAVLVP